MHAVPGGTGAKVDATVTLQIAGNTVPKTNRTLGAALDQHPRTVLSRSWMSMLATMSAQHLRVPGKFCPPVDLELLQLFSNLEDEVEALVGLVCGEGKHLIIHTMVLHVLQHSRGYCCAYMCTQCRVRTSTELLHAHASSLAGPLQ